MPRFAAFICALFLSLLPFRFAHADNVYVLGYSENGQAPYVTCPAFYAERKVFWGDHFKEVGEAVDGSFIRCYYRVDNTWLGGQLRQAVTCPAGSTYSASVILTPSTGGGGCVPNSGYECSASTNTCVATPPPSSCPAPGTSAGAYHFTVPPGGSVPDTFQEYQGPCVLSSGSSVCTLTPDGTRHCTAETKHTGQACPSGGCTGSGAAGSGPAPSPSKDTPASTNGPCQPGYYYGTVNGSVVCVPGQGTSSTTNTSTTTTGAGGTTEKSQTTVTSTGTSPNGTQTTQTTQTTLEQQWSAARQITNQSESSFPSSAIPTAAGQTKTTTVTNSDGSKTEYTLTKNGDGTVTGTARDQNTVQKTESTTCTGSSCTVSSTTTTNGTQTSSTNGTTTKEGLCQADPGNAQCGDGDGMFAGTCTSGFQCDGDPVQCAMAKKQHEVACMLTESSAEADRYDAVKALTGNRTGDNPNNGTVAISASMFDTSSATGGGACIANKSVTVWGTSITLPFSDVCQWLDALGSVLVAVSFLIAGRIAVGR